MDYRNPDSRVSKEHDDSALQEVALVSIEVPDWKNIDAVCLGYPIWWGASAWPVDSFIKANSFEGKTVYPFATSASSGIGSSAADLAALAQGCQWEEGKRFSASVPEQEIREWLVSIGAISQQPYRL